MRYFDVSIYSNDHFVLEICNNDELPEVELISLLEETIPQYKLRADTLTQFTGNNCLFYIK